MQQLTTADWEWVLGVNLWGVIHGVRAFLPLLVEQGEGHIVNTASMAGLTTAPMMGPYTVSKHGVVALSETLVKELGMQGSKVGVSVLCPGWVNTRIAESDRNRPVELGGAGPGAESPLAVLLRGLLEGGLKPDEVAGHVVDAVRDGRFYILTHPEMAPAIEERMQDILQGRTPGMMGSGISALFNQ
jgi:NAD(P)-dependent dehydrogenase (short-subunit alcohol dehydrogenase family)